MSSNISYSQSQLNQIDELKDYIENYCTENNINPAIYQSALDGKIDENLKNDPVFQAYWQLAYLQLMEILYPTELCSMSGEVGEPDFDTIYNSATDEMNDFVEDLLADSPELIALFSDTEDPENQSLLSTITAATTESTESTEYSSANSTTVSGVGAGGTTMFLEDAEDSDYESTDTREFVEEYGIEGFDYIIGTEEGIRAAQGSILEQISEMDQAIVEMTELFNSGEMSSEEYQAEMDNISVYRETLLGFMTTLENNLSTIIEMYSKLVEQTTEMQSAVISRWGASA